MFIEPSPATPLSKVLITFDYLLSLPILGFPLEDDPSGNLDATILAAEVACPLSTTGIATVLFPCLKAIRSAIPVAAVPASISDEGKDSWGA